MKNTFLLLVFLSLCGDLSAQKALDCSSSENRQALFDHYSRQAHQLGLDNPGWIAAFDTLISLCPNISEAYQERGLAHIPTGNYEKLFADIDKAVELEPRRWIAYRGYLHCILAGNYQKAITDFEAAEKMMPHAFTMDHTFSFFIAMSYMGLGNYEKSETFFQKDIATQQRGEARNDIHYNTLLFFGIMYYKMNDFERAEQRLKECLHLYEMHPTANYYMGLIKKLTGHPQKEIYFRTARQAIADGYSLNEPNSQLVPYPMQVTLADLDNN